MRTDDHSITDGSGADTFRFVGSSGIDTLDGRVDDNLDPGDSGDSLIGSDCTHAFVSPGQSLHRRCRQ